MTNIEFFNIDNIEDNSTILITGKQKTGRTELATNIINHKFHNEIGIIFTSKKDSLRYSGFKTDQHHKNAKYVIIDDVPNYNNIIGSTIDKMHIIVTDYLDIVNIPNINYIFVFNSSNIVHKKICELYKIKFDNPKNNDCIVIRLSDRAIFRYNSRYISDNHIQKFIVDDITDEKNSSCALL